jgi:hypothetical protein
MRVVDAQTHLWGSGLPSNMAHRQVTSFTTEEAVCLMVESLGEALSVVTTSRAGGCASTRRR